MSAVYAHSVEILMTNVTSVIVLGTWLEIVPVIAAMLEQHHPVAGNLHLFTVIQHCCSWPKTQIHQKFQNTK